MKYQGIFDKGFTELADVPFLKFTDMLKVAPDLIKLQSYKNVYQYVSQFIKDDFLRMCFSFHPLLVGGNPFDTTSIYAMIHYLEREWGVHYAMGGTGAIVKAFEKLIAEQGGNIHLSQEVDEIIVKNGKAVGVRLANGEKLDADVVVSNADVAFTYKNLINPSHRRKYTDRKIARTKYSMSLFVIYFGIKHFQTIIKNSVHASCLRMKFDLILGFRLKIDLLIKYCIQKRINMKLY